MGGRMRRRMRWLPISPELENAISLIKAVSAGPRWIIIKIIGNSEKTTSEIYAEIVNKYGFMMPRSLLYYHLATLEAMGIIEPIRYQETGKGGAPEKVWKLKVRRIVIDLSTGEIRTE